MAFQNTSYTDTVKSVLTTQQSLLQNTYYKFSDQPPTPVEYFHIDKNASTLDEGSKLSYQTIGQDSPIRFNLIHNFMIYGVDTPMSMNWQNDDFGLEASRIEGDATILPNTIIPYPDDRFIISYLKEPIMFEVTHAEPDTLEDGTNAWKISYRSSSAVNKLIYNQVIAEFDFILSNVGTDSMCVLKSDVKSFIEEADATLIMLKQYFKRLFYNKRVQTFIYPYKDDLFYDPYMIEFLKKNRLLEGDGEYIYIQHQTDLDPLFPLQYKKTIMHCIEKKDYMHMDGYEHAAVAKLITNQFTIFYNRIENFWEVYYDYPTGYEPLDKIPCFMEEFLQHVYNGETLESNLSFYNIIIKYLYDSDIDIYDINNLSKIHWESNPIFFYAIPCIIFCLQQEINKLLQKDQVSETLK